MSEHDPLCPARNRPASWEPEMCVCDIIAKVRADERERATEATRTALADAKWSNAVTVDWANGYIAAMKVALKSLRGES